MQFKLTCCWDESDMLENCWFKLYWFDEVDKDGDCTWMDEDLLDDEVDDGVAVDKFNELGESGKLSDWQSIMFLLFCMPITCCCCWSWGGYDW